MPRRDVYTIKYDDGVSEDVRATTPAEAVAKRARKDTMPRQIMNRTLLNQWCQKRVALQRAIQNGG